MSKTTRNSTVETLTEQIKGSPNLFVTDFSGLNVLKLTELRRRLRASGARYVVVKNTLALIAIKDGPMDQLRDLFAGPVAVAFHNDDAVGLAKALSDSAKQMPAIEVRGGLVNGQQVAGDQIQAIASLPTREELIAKLLFLLQSPITRLARVLAAVPREFVVVLDQIRQKKEQA